MTLLLFACNQNSEEQANKEFYFSPTVTEDVEHTMTPSGNYVDLQIKMHSAYTLLKALNAGCNLVLYCEGRSSESLKLLRKIPPIDEFTKKKTSEFYRFLR